MGVAEGTFQEYFRIFMEKAIYLQKCPRDLSPNIYIYIYIYCFGNILRLGALGAQISENKNIFIYFSSELRNV